MNAVDPDHPAQLLVNDNHSGRSFLIDTGAQVSLLPATAHARRHPSPTAPKLVAANGSSIASYGTQQTHVQLGKRKFTVTFIIADVRRPILGADFLRRHKLLVDLCGQKWLRPLASQYLLLVLCNVQAYIKMLLRVTCQIEYFIIELFIDGLNIYLCVVLGISC